MYSTLGAPLRFPDLLEDMAVSLRHRGPDGGNIHVAGHVGLGCRRLRVIDLRERADQPFSSPDRRLWIACNGEIYNHLELRQRHPAYPFTTRCDVEVILPLYLEQGAQGVAALEGMFGLAVWDGEADTLLLARDRAGEKPLFYARVGNEVWFASEIQTLLVGGVLTRSLDFEALHQYLTLGYVPEPRTLFREIRKVPAGSWLRFKDDDESCERYWTPEAFATEAETTTLSVVDLRRLLRDAVTSQLQADVPVGVFLSGGLDSALLANIAAQEMSERLHTFTARFSDDSYDEGNLAAESARRIGSYHHEVVVDPASLSEALHAVTSGVAEPIADPAVLPTYLIAREAREHVTVALSGEGADELFGGYPTYVGHRFAGMLEGALGRLIRPLGRLVDSLPASRQKVPLQYLLSRFFDQLGEPMLVRHEAWFGAGAQGALLEAKTVSAFPSTLTDTLPSGLAGAMLLDYATYLRDGLLVKIDRATMLSSLEARAPFLDAQLTTAALGLPVRDRLRGVKTKWLLKKAAEEWIPPALIHRKKRGLSVPIADWIDKGLRAEVDRLLDPARLGKQEIFSPPFVERTLAEHRSGARNHARPLWALVMFQYWLESWMPERAE